MSETLREEDLGISPVERMRQALIPNALYVATESFFIKNPITGADEHVRKGVDRARGSHPYVQQVPQYWEPVSESVKYEVFEAATKAPGEQRQTSTPVVIPAAETAPEVLSQGAPDNAEQATAGQVNATPTAIAHAKELGINIADVKVGTGKDGQIVKSDVQAHADALTKPS